MATTGQNRLDWQTVSGRADEDLGMAGFTETVFGAEHEAQVDRQLDKRIASQVELTSEHIRTSYEHIDTNSKDRNQ